MIYRLMLDCGYEDFNNFNELILKYPKAIETARVDNIYYFQ